MEEQRRHRHRSARLGNKPGSCNNGSHGGANLRLRHGNHAIDECLDVREIALPDALCAQSVGDGAAGKLRPPRNDLTLAKDLGGIARKLGFDPKDL